MKRDRIAYLQDWIKSPTRKPLVMRGARQVGKTWLVRKFAEVENLELLEINFENQRDFISLFSSNDPAEILLLLGARFNKSIDPNKTLLFLDEIQTFPELLAKLRWFAEDMPELALIATGSLLEFVLNDHTFSMPVGRITYMHLEPLSFDEFLMAHEQIPLLEYLKAYSLRKIIPQTIHDKLMQFMKEYIIVGGLPAAVSAWISSRSLSAIHQIHTSLLATYRDDFAKYRQHTPIERLEEVLISVPRQLAKRFIYKNANPAASSESVKKAFTLLSQARICHFIKSTAANGIPLGAEVNDKFFKGLFIDVGLCSNALGLALDQLAGLDELILVNNGGIAEQLVGQQLRVLFPAYQEPQVYYWQREKKGSDAEIDYILQHKSQVIPIEVKAGTAGGLKSLHLFMGIKEYPIAIRINSDTPSLGKIDVVNSLGVRVTYTLLSCPMYLISQLHRLLNEL
ncbi:MAG: ATP-binding protein [Verrucomicrobia bacterium]|nr:ATP-binding protein [Verrucomicrobiota bacterium]MBS0635970.1 ATP-binding protein [Verrucomicrobiota bacterium]